MPEYDTLGTVNTVAGIAGPRPKDSDVASTLGSSYCTFGHSTTDLTT